MRLLAADLRCRAFPLIRLGVAFLHGGQATSYLSNAKSPATYFSPAYKYICGSQVSEGRSIRPYTPSSARKSPTTVA